MIVRVDVVPISLELRRVVVAEVVGGYHGRAERRTRRRETPCAPPARCPPQAAPLEKRAQGVPPMKIPLIAMLLGSAALKVGDRAPDFTLPDTDGKPVRLSALLERGPVILAFFVKAFTPG